MSEIEKDLENRMKKEKSITLSINQWLKICIYILISTGFRKSKITGVDAEFWKRTDQELEDIRKKIEKEMRSQD